MLLWVRAEFGPVGYIQLYFLHIFQKAQWITLEIDNIEKGVYQSKYF